MATHSAKQVQHTYVQHGGKLHSSRVLSADELASGPNVAVLTSCAAQHGVACNELAVSLPPLGVAPLSALLGVTAVFLVGLFLGSIDDVCFDFLVSLDSLFDDVYSGHACRRGRPHKLAHPYVFCTPWQPRHPYVSRNSIRAVSSSQQSA